MKNFIQSGNCVTATAPRNLTSGAGCQIGAALFGVATHAAASGAPVELMTTGVFELQGTPTTPGARVYWDNVGFTATGTVGSNLEIGVAIGGGRVRLRG